ncbi:MAG: helix-turn-helix transcriptional regulator [Eubacteriales bacterium]
MHNMGEKIKDLRKAKNFTQDQLAYKLGKTKSVISSYETSQRLPTLSMLKKLAVEFGVTTDYLLSIKNTPSLNIDGLSNQQVEILYNLINEFKK